MRRASSKSSISQAEFPLSWAVKANHFKGFPRSEVWRVREDVPFVRELYNSENREALKYQELIYTEIVESASPDISQHAYSSGEELREETFTLGDLIGAPDRRRGKRKT